MVKCVNNELFPVLSVALKKCIDDKLSEDSSFNLNNFSKAAIDDVMERVKTKRTMNNKEIEYLKGLFQRAIETTQKRLVSCNFAKSTTSCTIILLHVDLLRFRCHHNR